MAKLTREEVADWIRQLIPYMEKPAIMAPKGFFNQDDLNFYPGGIIEYGDSLTPSTPFVMINHTENLKALTELYKAVT